jgi:hypothetical protein
MADIWVDGDLNWNVSLTCRGNITWNMESRSFDSNPVDGSRNSSSPVARNNQWESEIGCGKVLSLENAFDGLNRKVIFFGVKMNSFCGSRVVQIPVQMPGKADTSESLYQMSVSNLSPFKGGKESHGHTARDCDSKELLTTLM